MIWPFISLLLLGSATGLHFWWKKRYSTARKTARAEIDRLTAQQRQSALDALAEKEALVNSMVEGVLGLDRDGRIRLANRALGTLFGLDSDVTGKTVLEALRIHDLADVVARLSKDRQVLGVEITLAGLNPRIFEVNATAIFDRDSKMQAATLVFHDLTRLKQLEKTRQEFVANVSHELRTPLSLIKGYVETLIDGAKDKPEVAERFLQTIDRNANRLTLLIEDLLTISRLESGKAILNLGPLDLNQATARALEDFYPRARDRGILLTNDVPAGLIARADSNRIHQVFSNLLDNAIKYGRIEGTVTVCGRAVENGRIEISVSDDGPGIPPDAIGRIFERFYRVDKARSRDQGGTGLGLSIVKHIIQSHGGKAWVASQLGQGSTFFFTLESVEPAAAPEKKAS